MYKSKLNLNEDPFFQRMLQEKQISEHTIDSYLVTLEQYMIVNNIDNFTDYIFKVKSEQHDKIVDNLIIKYEVQYSELNKQFNTYKKYLINKKNNNNTINKRLTDLITIFKFFNIQVPDKILVKSEKHQWFKISKQEIKYILSISNLKHRALILMMATTGMRRTDLSSLNVIDFFDATKDYHNFNNITDFINSAPDNMIGFFSFKPHKTRKFDIECKVCCTPETSNAILLMLRERQKKYHKKGLTIEPRDPLFSTDFGYKKGRLKQDSMSVILRRKQEKMVKERNRLLKIEYDAGKFDDYEYEKKLKEIPKITPHALRKFFISTVAENVGNLRVSALMEGHAPPMNLDVNYVQINDELIKDEYMKLIPALSFEKVKVDLLTSQRKVELEEKIEHLEKENREIRDNIQSEATRAVERALQQYYATMHDNIRVNNWKK